MWTKHFFMKGKSLAEIKEKLDEYHDESAFSKSINIFGAAI